ncbi:MAG: dinitrogenase iron-molybdenum cofactor [Archaeoglobus sp.]|nr:MAG: dinitrogenase iron-molybdenum cofactor [Archaeoglobus sp.]
MKIAASTSRGGLDDVVIEIFGRAPNFTIVEVDGAEIKDVEIVNNERAMAGGGAGIAAAQLMIDKNVSCVLTGNIGPNAYNVLTSAGIKIYRAAGMNVREAVEKAIRGELENITSSGGGGRMGRGMGGRRMGRM